MMYIHDRPNSFLVRWKRTPRIKLACLACSLSKAQLPLPIEICEVRRAPSNFDFSFLAHPFKGVAHQIASNVALYLR